MTFNAVPHSTGLVLVAEDEATSKDASFRVGSNGGVHELGGWGLAGPYPELNFTVNRPPNPQRVHTVIVSDDSVGTRKGVRKLIDEHVERYGECNVHFTSRVGRHLRNWIAIGSPEDGRSPSDEEMREEMAADVPKADDHLYVESHPRGPETSKADIPDPLEVEKQQVAEARAKAAKEGDRQAQERQAAKDRQEAEQEAERERERAAATARAKAEEAKAEAKAKGTDKPTEKTSEKSEAGEGTRAASDSAGKGK